MTNARLRWGMDHISQSRLVSSKNGGIHMLLFRAATILDNSEIVIPFHICLVPKIGDNNI